MRSIIAFGFVALLLAFSACKKAPGPGGKAKIRGKVYVKNYNSNFTSILSEYYLQGENVFITYGEENVVGDNVKTSYDGSYEFPYLRPGTYKVFAVSKDPHGNSAEISVIREVVITGKKQVVEIPDIVVYN